MARCSHEGICNCDLESTNTVKVSGRGQPNNPFHLDVQGQAMTGQGLSWDPQRQRWTAKLGSGGGLSFDASGGIIMSEKSGEGGGTIPGASVAELLKRASQQDIVGGWLGAGYMIKPQGTKATYTYGVQRGLDMMHVPTRFLTDGTPVVTPSDTLTTQNGAGISDYDNRPTYVAEQTIHRWRDIPNEVGIWNPRTWNRVDGDPDYVNDSAGGWFGFLEQNETGLPSLADVFDLVGRSSVLLVELEFPPINYDGAGNPIWAGYAPTASQISQFLDRVAILIQRYGLQQSVIITTSTPTVPGATGTVDVLARFVNAAIPAGPKFNSTTDSDRYPPGASWPAGWRTVFCHTSIPPATVKSYVDAGTPAFYFPVSRQAQHAQLTQPSGAAGVLAAAPEYYAGQFSSHPTMGSWAYRQESDRFWFSTVLPGLLPPVETLDTVHPAYRGFMPRAKPKDAYLEFNQPCYQADPPNRKGQGVYAVLQGWLSPMADPTSYSLTVIVDVGRPDPGGGPVADPVSCALLFGVPDDTPFTSLSERGDHAGYLLTYHTEGQDDHGKRVSLWAWNPDANDADNPVELMAWTPNWVGSKAGLRVRVNPKRVEVQAVDANNPDTPVGDAWDSSTAPDPAPKVGTLYRGGYVSLGRIAADPNHIVQARFRMLRAVPRGGG